MSSDPPKAQNKTLHYVLILLMFACTGFTIARLGGVLMGWLDIERFSWQYWFMWVALLPLYNVVLLLFSLVFGKFQYVREKQRRTWRRIKKLFGFSDKSGQ